MIGSPRPRQIHWMLPETSSSSGAHSISAPHAWRPTMSVALVNPPTVVNPRELSPIVGSQYRGSNVLQGE